MSRKAANQAAAAAAAAGSDALPTIPPISSANAADSHWQLTALNKRANQLLKSIMELEAEIEQAPGLADWPHLISRHSTLLSQLYSTTSSLTSSLPNYVSSQQSSLISLLTTESKNSNIFLSASGSSEALDSLPSLPKITYSDSKNKLSKLSTHPIKEIQELEKRNLMGNVLRTRFQPDIVEEDERLGKAYEDWRELMDNENNEGKGNKAKNEDQQLTLEKVLRDKREHDDLVDKSSRIWFHKLNEPDSEGVGYDFKMRLPVESDGREMLGGDDEEMEDGEEMEVVE